MVATRHSLPIKDTTPPPSAEPEDEPSTPKSIEKKRKLQNALKKLEIDAKDNLIGGGSKEKQKQTKEVNTYHFRGAVYEVNEGTDREWIEQQPERYKKRESSSPAVVKGKGKGKVKDESANGKAVDGKGKKRQRDEEVDEAEVDDDAPSAKRPRRNADKYDISYARPRKIMDFTPSGRKHKKRQRRSNSAEDEIDRMRTSRLHDYTVVGGHEELSCMQHAKRRAERRGFQVKMLEYAEPKVGVRGERSVESTVVADMVKLARLNSQIEKGRQELEEVRRKIMEYPEFRARFGTIASTEARRGRDIADDKISTATAAARNLVDPNTSTNDTTPIQSNRVSDPTRGLNQSLQALERHRQHDPTPSTSFSTASSASPSPSTEVEIITSRHDSGTSLTPPPAATVPTNTNNTTAPIPLNIVTGHLPNKAKDGSTLRWSLPGKITEPGRAEEGIYRGRLKGESKAARRRRVKREFALVKQWQIEAEDGEENGVEGAEAAADEEEGEEEYGKGGVSIEHDEENIRTPSQESNLFVRPHLDTAADAPEIVETPSPTTATMPASVESGGSGSSGERRSSRMEEKKSKLCKLWMKGSCWRGKRCTFAHGAEAQ